MSQMKDLRANGLMGQIDRENMAKTASLKSIWISHIKVTKNRMLMNGIRMDGSTLAVTIHHGQDNNSAPDCFY